MEELQQEKDLREIELRDKYEKDLSIADKCISQLQQVKKELTAEYEKEYLAIQHEFKALQDKQKEKVEL